MAEDRLFRVIVLGGIALIGAAPAVTGCTPADAPAEGTQVPQSQTVVVSATPPLLPPTAASGLPPLPPREGPPPPSHYNLPVVPEPVDAGAPPVPVTAPVDAGTDGGFHLKPPREGPPPRPKQGL
jgi:hypothetical protein